MSKRIDELFTKPGGTKKPPVITANAITEPVPTKAGRRRRSELEKLDESGRVDQKATYYTISVRFPKEYKDILKDVVFDERLEGGITEYINNLVQQDLKNRSKI